MKCAICREQEATMGVVCSPECEQQLETNAYFGFVEASL